MRKQTVRRICVAGIIAALYAVTTILLAPISYGSIQCRISESLTLLAILAPEAIWGVTLGCAVSNLIGVFMGTNILGFADVLIGTAATFLAAVASYRLREVRIRELPVLSALMPVVFNGVFIGAELGYVLGGGGAFWPVFWLSALEVAAGEAAACLLLGLPLARYLEKNDVLGKSLDRREEG